MTTFSLLFLTSMVLCLNASPRFLQSLCPQGDFWANPDDVHSYYQCNEGTPLLVKCYPSNLVWNQDALYCDYPASATCVESTFWADDTDPTQYYQCVNGAGVLNQACLKSISLEYLGIILY